MNVATHVTGLYTTVPLTELPLSFSVNVERQRWSIPSIGSSNSTTITTRGDTLFAPLLGVNATHPGSTKAFAESTQSFHACNLTDALVACGDIWVLDQYWFVTLPPVDACRAVADAKRLAVPDDV